MTVVTNARVFYTTRGCGRTKRPAFPAPSVFEGGLRNSSDASRRENAEMCRICRCGKCSSSVHPSRRGLPAAPQDEVFTSGAKSDPHGEEAQRAVSNHEAPRRLFEN